jgi:hypothetical protein
MVKKRIGTSGNTGGTAVASTQTAAATTTTAADPPKRDPVPDTAQGAAFISQGEQRVECAIGRHAKMVDDHTCGCVSTTDASDVLTETPDAQCTGSVRAEADECIFKCPEPSASNDTTSGASTTQ